MLESLLLFYARVSDFDRGTILEMIERIKSSGRCARLNIWRCLIHVRVLLPSLGFQRRFCVRLLEFLGLMVVVPIYCVECL